MALRPFSPRQKIIRTLLDISDTGYIPESCSDTCRVDVGTSVLSEQSLFYTLLLGSFLANLTNRQEAKALAVHL